MRKFASFFLFFILMAQLKAQNYQTLSEGPIHEAFITTEVGDVILEAVPIKPPQDIQEEIPEQGKSGMMWIPGYWSWSRPFGDFVWVSGIWRKPPIGRQWVSGYWKRFSEGWVWIQGFWNESSTASQFSNISKPPPDPIDENVPLPPQPQELYFWIPGYWQYHFDSQSYTWISGKWEALREHWIYVPLRYLWREDGFIVIKDYWDYTLENRGVAYTAVYVNPSARAQTIYRPSEILQPIEIAEILYPSWPNYSGFFRNHFYFHRDLWNSWGGYPPWWNWSTWWTFTWQDSWWLWWWWTHPGYPNPPWLTADLASKIKKPPNYVLKVMKTFVPPQNVTPNGVVGNYGFIRGIQTVSGKLGPILPSDPKQVQQIQELAKPNPPKVPYLEPSGTGPVSPPPKKPFFGPSPSEIKNMGESSEPPNAPEDTRINLQEKHETTQKNIKPNGFKDKISHVAQFFKTIISKVLNLSQLYLPVQIIYIEIAPPPSLQPPPTYTNPTGPTPFFPGHAHPPPPYAPNVDSEFQGHQVDYYYEPLHMQHRDRIMYGQLDLENPPGPSVHPTPGDYSTVPIK